MSIEIRQMVVKSNIVQREGCGGANSANGADHGDSAGKDTPEFREALLDDCRSLILAMLEERRER